jgi:hypothetical protein
MASYASALKSARMQAVIAAIDANIEPAFMEIGNAGVGTVAVTITLDDPSFTEASPGHITMNGMPKWGTALVPVTVVEARIRDGAGNIVVSGLTVGLSDADIILDFVDLVEGKTVTLSQASITHSP